MGTTHRTYELKKKNISLDEGLQDIWKIYHSLCTGKDKVFYHQFSLTQLERLDEIQSKFELQVNHLYSKFSVYEFNQLIPLFESSASFERMSLSNLRDDASVRNYLHYWITISPSSFDVSIVLPITEDFKRIKTEIRDILSFLVGKGNIELRQEELVDLVNNLIDVNLEKSEGYTYDSRGVNYYAKGDFYPKGSRQIRPATIKLSFDAHYFKKYNGMQNALASFYQSLNQYFTDSIYKVEGTMRAAFDKEIYSLLSAFTFLNFHLPIYLDLNKNPHFRPKDLALTSSTNSSFTIERFDWKDSDPNYLDNRINLWINTLEDWTLTIEVSKQINEEYYFNIELLIDKELEYTGLS